MRPAEHFASPLRVRSCRPPRCAGWLGWGAGGEVCAGGGSTLQLSVFFARRRTGPHAIGRLEMAGNGAPPVQPPFSGRSQRRLPSALLHTTERLVPRQTQTQFETHAHGGFTASRLHGLRLLEGNGRYSVGDDTRLWHSSRGGPTRAGEVSDERTAWVALSASRAPKKSVEPRRFAPATWRSTSAWRSRQKTSDRVPSMATPSPSPPLP
jgi:hypothetical protein